MFIAWQTVKAKQVLVFKFLCNDVLFGHWDLCFSASECRVKITVAIICAEEFPNRLKV